MNLDAIPAPRQRRRKGSTAPAAVGRCCVYVRVSTDEQAGSLDSQEVACRAEAARRGLEVTAVYSDDGQSGGSMDRPELAQLRAAVQAGEFEAVIVYAVDRLSRRQSDTLSLLEQFSDSGAGLISASQPFETATPVGRAMIGFLSIFAELQREDIRARTKAALDRKRAAGLAVGRPSYGLRIAVSDDGKRFVTDPATWPVVERILAERAAGASCQHIADRLNQEGTLTPTAHRGKRPGGSWSAATIAALCRSRAVREVAAA